jgi:hypothetical protein
MKSWRDIFCCVDDSTRRVQFEHRRRRADPAVRVREEVLTRLTLAVVTVALLIYSPVTAASPDSDLLKAQSGLRAAFQNRLALEQSQCNAGRRDSCQDAVLSTIRLNNLNGEIALHRLQAELRGTEIRSSIDDALEKLDDFDSAVSDVQDKMNE